MNRDDRQPYVLKRLTLILLFAVTAPAGYAQTTAVAPKPAAKSELQGAGPVRTEDPKFRKRWDDRRKHFAELAPKQNRAIVFFGDSITQGWNDDFRGEFASAAREGGKRKAEGGLLLANRGIGGDTTRGLLARVDEDVLALEPHAIVLLIGTNDISLGVSPEDISNNVRLLIARINEKSPETPIVLCEVMPTSSKQKRPTEKIRELNTRLAEVARGNKQVTILDTYTLFANKEGEAPADLFPDLLHPNAAGYTKWRAALWPLLATLGLVETEADSFTPEPGYEMLFNGHDLTGWGFRATPAKEAANIKKRQGDKRVPAYPIVESNVDFDGKSASADGRYRAIAGRLVVTTPTEGRRIQQLATTKDFSGDFMLKLEFRATPNADSGVFIRGKQLQCRDYPLAGPYNNLKSYKPGDWNDLFVEVHGNKARCTCNSEVIEEAYELPEKGPIGLEGDRGQMEYRRIRIKH